jgi:hypothetical protein
MRRAQYAVPGAGGAEDGELAVFYFGQGQGGGVEANLDRWYGQFTQPDGGSTRASASRERRTVGTLAVTVTRARGTFAGGMPGAGPSTPRPRWALLGAIVETPGGLWFFKLTGPEATVEAARRGFDELLESLRLQP